MNKARVLIVDDEANAARLTALALQQSNRYEVKIETRPANALKKARAFLPDLILLDMKMPGKSGAEVLKEIRADAALADTPVVFLSSLLNEYETAREPLWQPRINFIAKTVDPETLLRSVDELVGTPTRTLSN